MLPSSSSQLARYGQINHYKKFWLLQTQLEKQEQSSTSLSLGVTGNANVKESKPLVSSTSLIANGDHLINSNNIAGHGSCRADMVTCSASSSRAGAFPYCSTEPGSLRFYTSNLGYTHMSNGNLRDSPALSLAVNCESAAHPINFLNQTWSPSSLSPASHELQSFKLPDLAPPTTHTIPEQVKVSTVEECESSECSNGGGEKRGQLQWDNASTSQSTSSISLSSKRQHQLAGTPQSNPPTSIISTSLHEVVALPSSSRSVHGGSGPLRTCTLCGTTKTPLWRGGPDGPKSLCNACGIRVKKTKRLQAAMEAAGVGAEGIISSASSPASAYKRLLATATKAAGPGTLKRKLSMEAAETQNDPNFQMKKKKKKAAGLRRSSCCSWRPPNVAGSCNLDSGTCRVFGDAAANLAADIEVNSTSSKNFSSNLFAQDVEEAAVLLMALSCGLVLS